MVPHIWFRWGNEIFWGGSSLRFLLRYIIISIRIFPERCASRANFVCRQPDKLLFAMWALFFVSYGRVQVGRGVSPGAPSFMRVSNSSGRGNGSAYPLYTRQFGQEGYPLATPRRTLYTSVRLAYTKVSHSVMKSPSSAVVFARSNEFLGA